MNLAVMGVFPAYRRQVSIGSGLGSESARSVCKVRYPQTHGCRRRLVNVWSEMSMLARTPAEADKVRAERKRRGRRCRKSNADSRRWII